MKSEDDKQSFFEHLDVFRKHLIKSGIALTIAAVAAFFFKDFLFETVILNPKNQGFITNKLFCSIADYFDIPYLCLNNNNLELINIKLAGQFKAHLLISFIAGFIVSVPYILFEIWKFIKPGLYKNEKKGFKGFVFFTSLLFFFGVAFGYYLIDPLTINFLSKYNISDQVENQIHFMSYISTVSIIPLSTGLVFQLPVIVYFLSKAGIISPGLLKKYRKHSIVIFLILSGIITPPDVISQILVALPLFLLYEMSISISRAVYKKNLPAG